MSWPTPNHTRIGHYLGPAANQRRSAACPVSWRSGQDRWRHRPCLTISSRYRPNLGGDEKAAMIAPHAVITVGTAAASFGTASVSA